MRAAHERASLVRAWVAATLRMRTIDRSLVTLITRLTHSPHMMCTPQHYICPITKHVLLDPVTLLCGHTFSKVEWSQWVHRMEPV